MGEAEVISRFWKAVKIGDTDEVKVTLNIGLGADVSETYDKEGNNALHVASKHGYIELVNELLPRFADINVKGSDSQTALHFAAMHGYVDVVKALLQVPKVDVNATNIHGNTPLHEAASIGSVDSGRNLLAQYSQTHVRYSHSHDAFHSALRGHVMVTKTLLEISDVNVNATNEDDNTPLHLAAVHGFVEIVKELLPCSANINAKGFDGATALHFAAWRGHIEVVRSFLEASNVDVDADDNYGWTPLQNGALGGCVEIVELLLIHNADINAKGMHTQTALHIATMKGHIDVVSALVLSEKLDIDGNTVFYFASKTDSASKVDQVKIIRILLGAFKIEGLPCGGNNDGKDEILKDAIFFAAKGGHTQVVDALLGVVDVNAKNEDNRNVLHLAAQNGHDKIVEMLLIQKGIDVNLLDTLPFIWL